MAMLKRYRFILIKAPLFQVATGGGPGGGGGGEGGGAGGGSRPSGRGTLTDPDVIQGMPLPSRRRSGDRVPIN